MIHDLTYTVPSGQWEINAEGDICIMTESGGKVCLHLPKEQPPLDYDASKKLVIVVKVPAKETIELTAQ